MKKEKEMFFTLHGGDRGTLILLQNGGKAFIPTLSLSLSLVRRALALSLIFACPFAMQKFKMEKVRGTASYEYIYAFCDFLSMFVGNVDV